MIDKNFKSFPARPIRMSDTTWELFRKKKAESQLTWDKFIKKVITQHIIHGKILD